MPKYRLHYFNGRGRAEVSRLLFVVAGVEFEDVRYAREEWPEKKQGFPFQQVPVLEIEGEDIALTQSFAIQRYLAREFNLIGSNSLETARIEEVMEVTVDAWMAMITAVHEKDETRKAERMKDFKETRCPTVLGHLEKVLCRKNDGNGFFVGDKLTVADLQVYVTLEARLIKDLVDDRFPKLKALFDRISQVPSIAGYLEKRPETPF